MSIAIKTKYHGPTHTRGSRVSATFMDSNHGGRKRRVYVAWDCECDVDVNHARALRALLRSEVERMRTELGDAAAREHAMQHDPYDYIRGSAEDGYVWVRVSTLHVPDHIRGSHKCQPDELERTERPKPLHPKTDLMDALRASIKARPFGG